MNPCFPELLDVKPGYHRVSKRWWRFDRGGWIEVNREKDGSVALWWTSGRGIHFSPCGPATCVGLTKTGEYEDYYESVLSMHCKYWKCYKESEHYRKKGLRELEWMKSKIENPPGRFNLDLLEILILLFIVALVSSLIFVLTHS